MRALARPATLFLIAIVALGGLRTAFSATPTASPFPFPTTIFLATNNTGQPANQLTITFSNPSAALFPLSQAAPGCAAPSYNYINGFPPVYYTLKVTWPTACVDPGESVEFTFFSDCTMCPAPTVSGYSWSGPSTPGPSTAGPVGGVVELAAPTGDAGDTLPWTAVIGVAGLGGLLAAVWFARRRSSWSPP